MLSIPCFSILLLVARFLQADETVHGNYWSKCDQSGIHFYEQLGCKANYDNPKKCPVSYTCTDYVIPTGKCLFYGKEIPDQETVDGSYCNKGFICNAKPDKKGYFTTGLIIDCFFGESPDGCYRGGELRRCCQEDICPKGDVYTCKVGNKTYKESELFTPEGTCWNCICKPGLELFKEPYCIRRPCDMELRNAQQLEKKCAPIYRKYEKCDGLCCPWSYICPEDVISDTPIVEKAETKEKCVFGDKTYNVGDQTTIVYKISRGEEKRTCSCLVPPYLSCQ